MNHLCVTCGTQFPTADQSPERCPICEDERQFVGLQGQQWIALDKLQQTHRNSFYQEGEGIWGIATVPEFGIGQRALLVRTGTGNILWDCVSLINPDTVALINALGGISAIAISHPHYYTSMVEWSRAFGGAPIYLHEDDREWVQRRDVSITFWQGETHALGHGLTLIRVGGHFRGFQVLHSAEAEHGHGALFTGDQPQVCPDKRFVSFMYSYPNFIPLDGASVRRIVSALEPFSFTKLYGAWPNFVVQGNAKEVLRRSAERYLRALGEFASTESVEPSELT
uniref:Metallo-beta-lactamase domain-containing protein n=1 Tax=uncultured bacterium Bio3 TaxID=460937 RepID=B2BKA2_9BACT|nr:unknown [uncultured bacterium Bio3]